MISHFPDSVKNVRTFPDHLPFSGQCHNLPDFSRSFPIFRTVSKLSGLFKIISHFTEGFKTIRIALHCICICIAFYCLALCCISLYCQLYCIVLYYISRTFNTHSLAMSWEANTRFLGLSRETVSRASSGIFLREKSCYPESFGFLRL